MSEGLVGLRPRAAGSLSEAAPGPASSHPSDLPAGLEIPLPDVSLSMETPTWKDLCAPFPAVLFPRGETMEATGWAAKEEAV